MKYINLTMPYLDVSFRVVPNEGLEKRIITPFGICDIIVRFIGRDESGVVNYEVSVNGDLTSWLYDLSSVNDEFREALSIFLRQLVVEDLLRIFPLSKGEVCKLEIKGCGTCMKIEEDSDGSNGGPSIGDG